jgi:penicillin-binding protein 1A
LANRGRQRVEPRFEGEPRRGRGSDFAVSEDDRPVRSRSRNRSKVRTTRGRRRRRSGFGRLVYWMFVLSIWGVVGVAAVVGYFGAKMPSANTWEIPDRAPNVRIVAEDGSLLANRGLTGGEAMGLREMSPYIPQAVVAIEDRRYYSHFGFDPIGFGRAMMRNVTAGRMVQGGSTLTQQLAKNLFLSPDRTLERKVQEVLLALWLEHKFSKDQILEMYLNRVYFGSGAYGVEAASRRYFNKSAKDVSLSEAAILASVLKAPSTYSPAKNADAANKRARLVLAAMRDQGMIGDKELASAESKPVSKAAAYWNGSQQYVADRVMLELKSLIGKVDADIVVDTTIDENLQQLAEQAVERQIAKSGAKLSVSQGALVSIDTGGAVKAYVGGADYADSQFDRAGTAKRQPGSTFKPFVYLAALEMGRTPESVRNDAPIKIGKWKPENYEGKYYGKVTLATALARSLNSVAAQLVMETGPDAVIETAKRLGIKSPLEGNLAMSLGTSDVTLLELTGAYSVFSNGGNHANIHLIKRVTDSEGNVLFENTRADQPRVVSAEAVAMMNYMLQRTLSEGTAKKAQFDWPAAGKTGTSQSFRDAWFIGYTAHLTTGVWFGNDDNTPTKKVTGGSLPSLAWKEFMTGAHEGLPQTELPGRWQPSQPMPDEPPVPPSEIGEIKRKQADPVAELIGKATMPKQKPSRELTGSTKRPVPPADVGPSKKKQKSEPKTVLDVILGE